MARGHQRADIAQLVRMAASNDRLVFCRPTAGAAAHMRARKQFPVMGHSGTKAALNFIAAVRSSAELCSALQSMACERPLRDVCHLAQEHHFSFTEAELRAAFKHDWAMRWHRFRSE